ncbi:hypothetical protein [Rhodoflexus sp.]
MYLLTDKYLRTAALFAACFFLYACQTRQEQLHALMQAGEVINNDAYDTLLLTDSLFPIIATDSDGQRRLIDTGLPCLTTETIDGDITALLTAATGDTLAMQFGAFNLSIGKRQYKNIGSGRLTNAAAANLQQKGIAGVIGANLMQHSTWHFDWEQCRVIVAPSPEKFADLPQTIALPFNRNIYRSPKWQVKFNRFPYQMLMQVSSGFGGGVLLDAEFTANHTSFMYERIPEPFATADLIYGISEAKGLLMDSLQIEGKYTFDKIPVLHSPSNYGLLGLAFLRRFNLTIDWRQRTIWLHPTQRGSIKSHRLP